MKKFFKKSLYFAKKYLTIIVIVFVFLFLILCNNSSFKLGNDIINNLKSITTSFTPTTDLFDDGSEVSFVSYFFGMKAKSNNTHQIEYYYPVVAQNLSANNYSLLFNYDGIVCSVAEGRVTNVGFNAENEKYVEIEQPDGRTARYEGLQTIGVATGNYVFANKPIGFATTKTYLKICLMDNYNAINVGELQWIN